MSRTPPSARARRASKAVAQRERQIQRKALRAQLREEREIQRLTRKLQREIERTHDRYQALATVLGSHARAIEAEHEARLAVNG